MEIKSGFLFKKGALGKRHRRFFVLQAEVMIYYRTADKQGPSHEIRLSKTSKAHTTKERSGLFGFQFVDGSGFLHKLWASTEKDRAEWVAVLSGQAAAAVSLGVVTGSRTPTVERTPESKNSEPKGSTKQQQKAVPSEEVPESRKIPSQEIQSMTPPRSSDTSPRDLGPPKDIPLRQIDKIDELYTLDKTLGSGGFAIVQVATEVATKVDWAAKVIAMKALAESREKIFQEIEVMRRIRHPNLVALHDVVETSQGLYIIMELMRGPELFSRIVEKGIYAEQDAAQVLLEIMSALAYIHGVGIAHCDLKPENLLYSTPDADGVIKIIDFGLAQFTDSKIGRRPTKIVGTPEYIAPEVVLRKEYAPPADMWAMGVIMYILLCGYYPFYSSKMNDTQEVLAKVCTAKYSFPPKEWDHVSEEAKDLIRKLLVVDVKTRLTAKQALDHDWFKLIERPKLFLPKETISNIKKFNARRKIRAHVAAVQYVVRISRESSVKKSQRGGSIGSSPATTIESKLSSEAIVEEEATSKGVEAADDDDEKPPSGWNRGANSVPRNSTFDRRITSVGELEIDIHDVQQHLSNHSNSDVRPSWRFVRCWCFRAPEAD